MRYDRKWIFALAVIGIPGAHGLHGYVGFVFGSLKSREWWSSDLMPVIFLFSAIISGTALLIVLYVVSCRLRKVPVDLPCLKGMAYTLWGFMMFTLAARRGRIREPRLPGPRGHRDDHGVRQRPAARAVLHPAVRRRVGLPILVLTFMIWRGMSGQSARRRASRRARSGAARGVDDALERRHRRAGDRQDGERIDGTYRPTIFGREGLLAAATVLVLPLVLLSILVRFLPPWHDEEPVSAGTPTR